MWYKLVISIFLLMLDVVFCNIIVCVMMFFWMCIFVFDEKILFLFYIVVVLVEYEVWLVRVGLVLCVLLFLYMWKFCQVCYVLGFGSGVICIWYC